MLSLAGTLHNHCAFTHEFGEILFILRQVCASAYIFRQNSARVGKIGLGQVCACAQLRSHMRINLGIPQSSARVGRIGLGQTEFARETTAHPPARETNEHVPVQVRLGHVRLGQVTPAHDITAHPPGISDRTWLGCIRLGYVQLSNYISIDWIQIYLLILDWIIR